MLRALGALFMSAVLAMHAVACGGDEFEEAPPPPCNEDPWTCGSGQTCWVNEAGTGFECLNGGPGAEGEGCSLMTGTVTCQAGLFCNPGNVCGRFCDSQDPNRACPEGMLCAPVQITNEDGTESIGEVQVCVQPTT